METLQPIASAASQRAVSGPTREIRAELEALAALAMAQGLHVEALELAEALVDRKALQRLKKLVFNPASLAVIRTRAARIEFIAEGPLPPELLLEPAAKSLPIYQQLVDYSLCKSCRLCIEVCPKAVYSDDGFGKPYTVRREEECTGDIQCAQCVSVCPERAISLQMVNPAFSSTVFVQLENPYAKAESERAPRQDFAVANPLASGDEFMLEGELPEDLAEANRVLDAAGFHPVLNLAGVAKHFVDAADPEAELVAWAREQGRVVPMVHEAVRTLYRSLPSLTGVKEGKYSLDTLVPRLIDELLYAGIDPRSRAGKQAIAAMLAECRETDAYLGSKRRPIGGLLPPGTSTAWKTPYGNEVPTYTRMEKCLGPECALCVTHCPEGNGGEIAAIRMVTLVPLGTVPALVRGLMAHLLRADGAQQRTEDMEDLSGRPAFRFEVDPDYCKACGICIACCPHDVIEPEPRRFDMGEKL